MEWRRGQVARSLAGHDKGTFLAVLEVAPPRGAREFACLVAPYAVVADGKARPLERPKRKKLFHLAPTGTALPEEALETNRKLRNALRPFAEAAAK